MKASGTFVPNERVDIQGEIVERPDGIALPKLSRSTFGNVDEIIIQKVKSCWVITPNDDDTHNGGSNKFIPIGTRHILAINSNYVKEKETYDKFWLID
jgi:hypothetical protein